VQVLELVARVGMTLLVATLEMGFARRVADRVVFMDRGRVVETGPPEDLFEHPREERTKRFLDKILA
jgi:ABC-type polar amino acid transport system ATPase subunit